MSTLIVNYDQLNNLTSTAKSLSKRLDSRINDYSGIRSSIGRISSGRNNISQANYFIQKKNEQLQAKKDKIDAFRTKIIDFKTEVVEADKRVARRISSDTKYFKKVNNISISVFSYIGIGIEEAAKSWFGRDNVNTIKKWGRSIKYVVKDWYYDRGGKYIVNIAKDIALVALAVAAVIIFPPAGLVAGIFAGFAIYNSVSTLVFDGMAAYNYFKTKNRSTADVIDDKGGKEATQFIVGGTAGLLGGDKEFWSDVAGVAHTGMSVAAVIYSLGKDYKDFKNTFTDFKTMNGSLFSKAKISLSDNFFTSATDVNMSGIFKFQSIAQKLIPSFSTDAAKKVAEVVWLRKNYKAFTGLTDYINIVTFNWTFDNGKWKVQIPSAFTDAWKKGSEFIGNFGEFKEDNATRIPPIIDYSNFKVPVVSGI